MRRLALISIFLLTSIATTRASAMGHPAKVFETSTSASIWDHGEEFYLRLDLSDLGLLKSQTFLWAGFHQTTKGNFEGEIVSDQFGFAETHFPARAKLMDTTESASYYRIEILGDKGEVIKELFLKGPARPDFADSVRK
ncbi:MAG: hypothetical protein V4655_03740 [Bdellovibrionota bacterium]